MKDYSSLYDHIGYSFNDPTLLKTALTHKSYSKDNNERLEFLGDSILSYVISSLLYELPAKYNEGELTRCRAFIVMGETLHELANEFNLSKYILLGTSESKNSARSPTAILANAIEAIIGAIYLDSDIQTCHKVLNRWYSSRIDSICPSKVKDPKTALQEYTQGKALPLPDYVVDSVQGQEHEQKFNVSCSVQGLKGITVGCGSSKRRAEQQAAQKYLELIKI